MEVGGSLQASASVTRETSTRYLLNRRLDGAQPEGYAENVDIAILRRFKPLTVQSVP